MKVGRCDCILERVTRPFGTAVFPKYNIIRKRLRRSVAHLWDCIISKRFHGDAIKY